MPLAVDLPVGKTLFDRHSQERIPVTKPEGGHPTVMKSTNRAARVAFRSVFEVGTGPSRLAIGHFNRTLLSEEVASLRRAYERARLPEVVDFEVTGKQVSFLSPAPRVAATWSSIETLLANHSLAEAS